MAAQPLVRMYSAAGGDSPVSEGAQNPGTSESVAAAVTGKADDEEAAAAPAAAAETVEPPDSTTPGEGSEQQQDLAAEEAAAAEAAELDEMLQQMMAEAEQMILGGHPQEAINHLTEVAEQLEQQLGLDHFLTYRLWDQITQLHQEQGQLEDALNVASRALVTLAALPDGAPVAAMFRMRRGAALFAMDQTNAAMKDFAEAAEYLRTAFSPDFEAIGEARVYLALARLKEAKDPEGVVRLEPRLREALKHMQQDKTNRGMALREAAMRQHDRIIDAATEAGNWPMVTALYEQQASLLRSAGMTHKLAATLYTHSTLLYIRGEAAEAEPAARESLALSRQLFPSLDDEVMLRNLRLGTILLERGQYMEAAELVAKAEGRFRDALQPDNPVRGEAAFALALARSFQLLPFQVAERRQLLDDMSAGLGVMAAGFGQEHQLVRKATVIWEAARRAAETIK